MKNGNGLHVYVYMYVLVCVCVYFSKKQIESIYWDSQKAHLEFSVRCYVKTGTNFLAKTIHMYLHIHIFFNSYTFLGKK